VRPRGAGGFPERQQVRPVHRVRPDR
jgi:hypothetical protein